MTAELAGKRLDFMHELIPTAVLALLVHSANPVTEPETSNLQAAARALGLQPHVLQASTPSEIDAAFETLVERRAGALVVSGDPFLPIELIRSSGWLLATRCRRSTPIASSSGRAV
jgi:putative ABC transport system substrate-binding protein